MKKFNSALAVFAVIALVFAGSFTKSGRVIAQERGVATVQSTKSFNETVGQAKQLVAKNGMMVLAEVNQGKILINDRN